MEDRDNLKAEIDALKTRNEELESELEESNAARNELRTYLHERDCKIKKLEDESCVWAEDFDRLKEEYERQRKLMHAISGLASML